MDETIAAIAKIIHEQTGYRAPDEKLEAAEDRWLKCNMGHGQNRTDDYAEVALLLCPPKDAPDFIRATEIAGQFLGIRDSFIRSKA